MSKNLGNRKNAAFAKAKRFRPVVESLESRLNLAGNVAVLFGAGNLYLTGDALSNTLRIEGNGPGVFEVAGVNTALGGVANGVRNFTGVRNIFLTMNNGDDVVTFVTAELPGLLSFIGGNGNDRLNFGEGNDQTQFIGSLNANLGAGNDTVAAEDEASITIQGLATILGGEGNNFIDFDRAGNLDLGFLTVLNGSGNDVVELGLTTFDATSVTINNGHGNNQTYIDGDVLVRTNVTVVGGNGGDIFNPGDRGIDFFDVLGSLTVNLGNGNNEVSFQQSNTFVQFATTIVTGNGNDVVEFLGETTDLNAVAISTGAGDDTVEFISSVATNIFGPVTIDTFSGVDVVNIFAADVRGLATLNTGEGNDGVFIDNSLFRNVVTLSTLGGLDRVAIEAGGNDDGVGTVFEKAVYVYLGLGDDLLEVGFDNDDFVSTLGFVLIDGSLGLDFILDSGTNAFLQNPTLLSIA